MERLYLVGLVVGHSNLVSLVKDGPCVLRDWCGYKYGLKNVLVMFPFPYSIKLL